MINMLPSLQMCIEVRDVDFAYANSNRQALNEVNFKIAAGSLVCIVGYNGAGKSTLINLMTRLADPTAGSVFISQYRYAGSLRFLLSGADRFGHRWSGCQGLLTSRSTQSYKLSISGNSVAPMYNQRMVAHG